MHKFMNLYIHIYIHKYVFIHIGELRKKFPGLKIAIIYVTADQDTILSRSAKRGAATGRVVPEEVSR
jgi:dephospho-CoA kinase